MHSAIRTALAAVSLLGFGAVTAGATTIDFNSNPAPTNTASFSLSGVTFSAVGGGGLLNTSGASPNGTLAILENNSPRRLIRADIAGGASFVSVDLGDFDSDPDTLYLEIFNAANVSLGVTTFFIPDTFTGMVTLSLSAPNIAYAYMGATAPAVNGSSVYIDNFTYEGARVIPEPASMILLGSGLLGWAARARRRR